MATFETLGDLEMGETAKGVPSAAKAETHVPGLSDARELERTPTGAAVRVVDAAVDYTTPSAAKFLAAQTKDVFVPAYATWFRLDSIDPRERVALPEFFNNKNKSKTPAVYKDYRDFMVHTYRLNPIEYLTVTACRRNLAGDVCSIMRVHSFLEQWGLINFQVDADSRPSLMGPSFTGHFAVTADTPRGLIPFGPAVPVNKDTSRHPKTEPFGSSAPVTATNLPLPSIYDKKRPVAAASSDSSPTKKIKYACRTCGVDCSTLRYHIPFEKPIVPGSTPSTGAPFISASGLVEPQDIGFNLCKECYMEGRFPSNLYSGDFQRISSTPATTAKDAHAPWTPQETLLLLEGIELFDQDWTKIAAHVGTRSKEACVLQFLEIPISDEDQLYGRPVEELGPLAFAGGKGGELLPFTGGDNPVLSVVGLLVGLVKPSVAKASAKAAVVAMKEFEAVKKEAGGDDMVVDPPIKTEHGKKAQDAISATLMESKTEPNTIEHAAATALGAAAVKATQIAASEAAEARRLTLKIISLHIKKMNIKLKHFEDVEAIVEAELKEVEREKKIVFGEKEQIKKEKAELQALKDRLMMEEAGVGMDEGGAGSAEFNMEIGGSNGTPVVRQVQAPAPSTDGIVMASLS
ncbi:SWIRM-domain-containing protein [Rhizoclosmatium globosum]|uniref:SWIRM-domain-containing protein n=1 Tax=Rhizoclosmatium globosum TaxID=329046 RepID=A0A1Y2D1T2_9FUNG|nr:SWIRM-domain-containing protein [Rhizoclosmatium globosum]|eukprot:ORY53167.1 SWIRM-domain-containing protein [Rhizoclosmatium globosum]